MLNIDTIDHLFSPNGNRDMALTEIQQLQKIIDSSSYCLVTFHSAYDIDSITSALAIGSYLTSKHKQVDMVCPNFTSQKNLRFLNGIDEIKRDISNSQKFTIKVDLSHAKLDTLSYDIKDNWLSIHLNPDRGTITKNELRTSQSSFKYDLIISINTPDLESLGDNFINNTDLFYRLPIINIDHNIANEHYGQINMVETESTSSSEIIYKILKQIDAGNIKDTLATYLLAGIISKTKNFKSGNITPYTLSIASELMNLGGDRDTIIKHLFYHRSIPSLKIWGKALSHLQNDPSIGLIWTSITRDDLVRSGASGEDVSEVIYEMLVNSPEAEIIVLLHEKIDSNIIHGLILTTTTNALTLAAEFNPQGNKRKAIIQVHDKTLKEVEEELIQNIQKKFK